MKEDGTADKTEPFAEGWLTENGEYMDRPVGVAQLRDGSLLGVRPVLSARYAVFHMTANRLASNRTGVSSAPLRVFHSP